MIKINEEYVVEIIDNGFSGEGIAKIDGITVFINGAMKGEKIKTRIMSGCEVRRRERTHERLLVVTIKK